MRQNRSTLHDLAQLLPVTGEATNKPAAKARRDWVWGNEDPVQVIDWEDLGDKTLVECGRLVRLHIRPIEAATKHPRFQHDAMIELSTKMAKTSFLAFDFHHPFQRLHLLLNPKVSAAVKARFWDGNPARVVNLQEVVSFTRGCQAKNPSDYQSVKVKVLGILTNVVYHTHKKGDGASYYIHQFGEVSGVCPVLCVDSDGKLYLAGGDYTCPVEGITN